nr:YeeE/YedE family protein [Gammaproteobacteria bacterium]
AGGILVLYGARLAGGCTSGHMMSGMMQTSISGYLFAIGAFIPAVVLATIMFGRK